MPRIVRNLIYHVYPIHGNCMWRRNLAHLLTRIELFNGKRIVGISYDEHTETPETVKAFLGSVIREKDYIVQPNSTLREVPTFVECLRRVETLRDNEITFWGHAKGVTRSYSSRAHAVWWWVEMLYGSLLDYPGVIEGKLKEKPIAGSFFREGKGFANSPSAWHYSGGMYWFHNRSVFLRSNWQQVDNNGWGAEAWPGVVFKPEEAGIVFFENNVKPETLYSQSYMERVVLPAFAAWRKEHAGDLRMPARGE